MLMKSENTKLIYQIIHKALIEDWDPIGIGDFPEAQDEYDNYILTIYEMYLLKKSAAEIFEYLWWLETIHMGLKGNKQKTEAFTRRLLILFSQFG